MPLSAQRESFSSEERPAKRSRTLPTRVFCAGESSTPGWLLMFVFPMGIFAGGLISIYSGSGAVIGYSQVDIFAVLMRENMCRWDLAVLMPLKELWRVWRV